MNPASGLSDAISAASLVLAVLAALYTLWLGDVSAAIAITPNPDPDDRARQKRQVTAAIWTKALPLCFATLAGFLILSQRAMAIACEAHQHWRTWGFDDVKAMFLLTVALLGLLACVAAVQVVRLVAKRIALGR